MTAARLPSRPVTLLLVVALVAAASLVAGVARAVDGPVDVVYVATGRNFPDALAGATLSAATGAPLLTVEPQLPLPAATVAALEALDPDRIVIFGGPGAVPGEVADALVPFARSGSVTRIEGDDRHGTAAAIAEALPSRVHDAERLDGRTGAALRTFPLPAWRIEGNATMSSFGPSLNDGATGLASVDFLVPPGHLVGEPLEVDLVVSIVAASSCAVRIGTNSVVFPPGADDVEVAQWELDGESSVIDLEIDPEQRVYALTAVIESDALAGGLDETGMAHTFRLIRVAGQAGDTCSESLWVHGGQLRY